MRIIVLTLAIFLAYCVSKPTAERTPSSAEIKRKSPEFERAMEKLRHMFSSRMLHLDRTLVTFHYESNDEHLTDQAGVQGQITKYIDEFYDETWDKSGEAGPGVYVALDPYTSRGYGRETPQLYVIPLRAGIRLLNLSVREKETDSVLGFEVMRDLGCPAKNTRPDSAFYNFIEQMRGSSSLVCRQAIIQVYRELGVQASIFGFGGPTTVWGSRSYRPDAISIITRDAIELDDVSLFSDTVAITKDKKLAPFTYRLFKEFGREFLAQHIAEENYWPPKALAPGRTNLRQYRAWREKYIGYFGPPRPLDDDSRYLAQAYKILNERYVDEDILRLRLELDRLIPKEVRDYGSVSLKQFNGIEELLAKADGISPGTPEYADFLKAHDYTNQVFGEYGRQAKLVASVLHEKFKPNYDRASSLNEMRDSTLKAFIEKPSLARLFEAYGMGPKTLHLHAQQTLLDYDGVPFFRAPFPMTTEEEDRAIPESRQLLRSFLSYCIGVYKDPRRNLDLITKGACGLRKSAMIQD